MKAEKPCSWCRTWYVGGFRSHRCPGCQRTAKDAQIARSKQSRRVREGRAPSPALQRVIDLAALMPPAPAPVPRRQKSPADRRNISIRAWIVARLDKAAIAARTSRWGIVGRILDDWAPMSPREGAAS